MDALKNVIEFAKNCGENHDLLLENETFNEVAKKSITKLNPQGILILEHEDEFEIQVSIDKEGHYVDGRRIFARVEKISTIERYSKIRKQIFVAPAIVHKGTERTIL